MYELWKTTVINASLLMYTDTRYTTCSWHRCSVANLPCNERTRRVIWHPGATKIHGDYLKSHFKTPTCMVNVAITIYRFHFSVSLIAAHSRENENEDELFSEREFSIAILWAHTSFVRSKGHKSVASDGSWTKDVDSESKEPKAPCER